MSDIFSLLAKQYGTGAAGWHADSGVTHPETCAPIAYDDLHHGTPDDCTKPMQSEFGIVKTPYYVPDPTEKG